MAGLRAVGVVVAIVLATLAILPVHALARWRRWPLRKSTARLWHRVAARLMGLRVTVHGRVPGDVVPGVLIAANHVSWLDIVVFGSVAKVSFVAKDEVRSWPFFGALARWQDSVFVARDLRSATRDRATAIARRLDAGDHLVLFAEGTTSDGNFIAPFKSALFGAALMGEAGTIDMQPVAIAYWGVDGMPMGRRARPMVAWPGDVRMAPHLWRVLREGRIDAHLAFGAPVAVTPRTDRKRLAAEAEQAVRTMASAMLRGRDPTFVADQNPLRAGR